jgi:hypothetical protein
MSELALKDFDILSDAEKAEALALLKKYDQLEKQDECQGDFISFVKHMWPEFVEGRHHKIIGEKFNRIAQGKLKRLIVCLPPRHTKSEFASTYFPAWMMGRRGDLKIIQTTHTAELAVRFGRRVRNIIDSEDYQEVFPKLKLQADNKSAGRWTTNEGGESFYSGVGGAITGRGADLLIIDDPVSEQDALSATAMDSVYEWYTSGPRQRLQPGGIIVIVMTRWSTKDSGWKGDQEAGRRPPRRPVGDDRVPSNYAGDRRAALARVLEEGGAFKCKSVSSYRQVEQPVAAESNCGIRVNRQA